MSKGVEAIAILVKLSSFIGSVWDLTLLGRGLLSLILQYMGLIN